MNQYLDTLREVLAHGTRQENRTGIPTYMIPGVKLEFNLGKGFPILTTKKINFKAVSAELCAFLRGYDNAALFRTMGTKIWDANANENKTWLNNPNRKGDDDLGRVYGVQWRHWRAPFRRGGGDWAVKEVDQLATVIRTLKDDPTSRRIIMTAWNPGELDQMALPPCHLMIQFLVQQQGNKLHACMYQRSCDAFLGVPFNISSYALLLQLIARITGYEPGTLTMFMADYHIYENHIPQVKEQLEREPRALPRLNIFGGFALDNGSMSPLEWLESLYPDDLKLDGYDPHPAIKAEMAV